MVFEQFGTIAMTTTSHASVSYRDLQPQDVDELIELHEQCFPVRYGSSAPIHPRRASGRPSHTAAARARLSPRARRYSRAFYDNAVQGKLANSPWPLLSCVAVDAADARAPRAEREGPALVAPAAALDLEDGRAPPARPAGDDFPAFPPGSASHACATRACAARATR